MNTFVQKPASYNVVWPNNMRRSALCVVITSTDAKKQRASTIKNKKLFLDILEKSRGIVTYVCSRTQISRATYYHWRKTDTEFAAKVDEILNEKPDVLEDRLYSLAMDGNVPALKFLLDRIKYKKQKEAKKESEVHIYHYVAKREPKVQDPTYEDVADELFEKFKAHEEQKDQPEDKK